MNGAPDGAGGGFSLHRNTRVLLAATALVAIGAVGSAPVKAFPPFAQKEGKPCAYCHVNPNGGGKRNYRGLYYKAHNLTFAEFDDAAEAKKASVEVGPDPDPNTKPKTWTAPKTEAPNVEAKPGDEKKPEEKKQTVAEAQAQVKTAGAAYKKNPKDAATKKAYAGSLADLGHATMLDQSIAPRKRYPDALNLYRQALKLDPTNKTALEDKKMIEDVYKSMGRPIPQ
jgi:tetratricopeptide (TPR) repeat protein